MKPLATITYKPGTWFYCTKLNIDSLQNTDTSEATLKLDKNLQTIHPFPFYSKTTLNWKLSLTNRTPVSTTNQVYFTLKNQNTEKPLLAGYCRLLTNVQWYHLKQNKVQTNNFKLETVLQCRYPFLLYSFIVFMDTRTTVKSFSRCSNIQWNHS